MNCNIVLDLLNDYIDGSVSDTDAEVVNYHCEQCASCSARLASMRVQIQSLTALPVPSASAGFEKRVIKNAIANGQSSQLSEKMIFKYGAVAMFLVVVTLFSINNNYSVDDQAQQLFAVGSQERTIKLAINTEYALERVTMRIELSDNLEISGFGNRKELYWTTDLQEGVNVIALPIVGIAQGHGDITTRIQLNDKEKVIQIKTQYLNPDNVLIHVDDVRLG